MKYPEVDRQLLASETGTDVGAADGEPRLARLQHARFQQIHAVAVNVTAPAVAVEQRTDGVVRANFFQVEHGGPNEAVVNLAAVAEAGEVAPGLLQALQEFFLEIDSEQFLGEL